MKNSKFYVKIAWIASFLILILVLPISLFNKTVSANTQRSNNKTSQKLLIVTGEYPPFVSENSKNYGVLSQIVLKALDNMGIPYEIKFYPWSRCEQMVLDGTAWATYPYGITEERSKNYLFSEPIYTSIHKYFYLSTNSKIKNEVHKFNKISDFKNYTFGGQNNYWYGDQNNFKKLGIKAEWAFSSEGLIQMLYNKRIDFFIDEQYVAKLLIKKLYKAEASKFHALENNAKTIDMAVMISKRYPNSSKIKSAFNVSLKKLKENGDWNGILKQWLKSGSTAN